MSFRDPVQTGEIHVFSVVLRSHNESVRICNEPSLAGDVDLLSSRSSSLFHSKGLILQTFERFGLLPSISFVHPGRLGLLNDSDFGSFCKLLLSSRFDTNISRCHDLRNLETFIRELMGSYFTDRMLESRTCGRWRQQAFRAL